jgi:hypothetical protein
MKVLAQIITDPRKISENENDLDAFLMRYATSPFSLLPFIRELMNRSDRMKQTPVIIIIRTEEGILGIAFFVLSRFFGVRRVDFLNSYWASPDFVLKDGYESIALEAIIRVALEELNCKFVFLCLNSDSPNLPILKGRCKSYGVPFFEHSHEFMDYGVVAVDRSWEDYRRSCGIRFAKELRHVRNKLDRAGKWKLTVVTDYEEVSEEALYEKIMSIEKRSWKERYRQLSGDPVDSSIRCFLALSPLTENKSADLKRKLWFLEIEGRLVAYAMVFQHRGVAYVAKTSFAEEYSWVGPGKHMMSAVMKDLFDCREVQKIDFMTYLPMVRFWRASAMKRVRVRLGNSAVVEIARIRWMLEEARARLNKAGERDFSAPTAHAQLTGFQQKHVPRPP